MKGTFTLLLFIVMLSCQAQDAYLDNLKNAKKAIDSIQKAQRDSVNILLKKYNERKTKVNEILGLPQSKDTYFIDSTSETELDLPAGKSSDKNKWNYVYEFDFKTGQGGWFRYNEGVKYGPVFYNVLLFNRNIRIHVVNINASRFVLDIQDKPNFYQFNSADEGNDGTKKPDDEKTSKTEKEKDKLQQKLETANEKLKETSNKISQLKNDTKNSLNLKESKEFLKAQMNQFAKRDGNDKFSNATTLDTVAGSMTAVFDSLFEHVTDSLFENLEKKYEQINIALENAIQISSDTPAYRIARNCAMEKFNSVFKIMESVESSKWYDIDSATGRRYKPQDILLDKFPSLINCASTFALQKFDTIVNRHELNDTIFKYAKLKPPHGDSITLQKIIDTIRPLYYRIDLLTQDGKHVVDSLRRVRIDTVIEKHYKNQCNLFDESGKMKSRYQMKQLFGSAYEIKKLMMQEMCTCLQDSCDTIDCCKLKEWMDNDTKIDELNTLAENIAELWNKFYKGDNEIWSDPFPVSEADETFENLNIKEVKSQKIYSQIKTPTVWVAGAVKFNFSAGIGFNGLYEMKFKPFASDSMVSKIIGNDTLKVARKTIIRTDRNKFEYGIVTLLHAYVTTGVPVNVGIAAGLSVTNELNADILFGGSVMFGRKERFVLSSGIALGKRPALKNGLSQDAGNSYNPAIFGDDEITENRWNYSWFASFSYNLVGKNNVFGEKKSAKKGG